MAMICREVVLLPTSLFVHNFKANNPWSTKEFVEIDACLAPLVIALNRRGIETLGCCCGHGYGGGEIIISMDDELYTGKINIPRCEVGG